MRRERRWELWLAAAGLALAVVDFALLSWLGVEMSVAGRQVAGWVFAYFAASFAAVGYLLGLLVKARSRARADAATIRTQMRALEASQRALVQQEKLAGLGRVAAGIAHEVRNPLGVIRSSASMVQESFDPGEEPHRACGFIVEEIDRLNGLIGSLLTFARPAELNRGPVHVEKAIDRALQLAEAAIERRRVVVERASRGGVPEVQADADLVAQIVLDLVQNACEAVGPQGRIEIVACGEGEEVHVDVADDGPGVPDADREKVFEPFFTTKDTGTGLGLSMAARIAQAHGGSLDLVPRAGLGDGGRGARFRLRLPLDGPRTCVAELA